MLYLKRSILLLVLIINQNRSCPRHSQTASGVVFSGGGGFETHRDASEHLHSWWIQHDCMVKFKLSLLNTIFVTFTESDINSDETSDRKKRQIPSFSNTPLCKNAACLTARKHGGPHVRSRVLPENFAFRAFKDSGLHFWISCFVKNNSGRSLFSSDHICLVAFGLWVLCRRKKGSEFAMCCLPISNYFVFFRCSS